MQTIDRQTFENCAESPGWMMADLRDAQWSDAQWHDDRFRPRGKLAIIVGMSAALWIPVIAAAAWLSQ